MQPLLLNELICFIVFLVICLVILAHRIYHMHFSPILPQNGGENNLRASLLRELSLLNRKRVKRSSDYRRIALIKERLTSFKSFDRKKAAHKTYGFTPQSGFDPLYRKMMYTFINCYLNSAYVFMRRMCFIDKYYTLRAHLFTRRQTTHVFHTIEQFSKPICPFIDPNLANLERITYLICSIADSKSYIGVTSAILQFIRTEYTSCLVGDLYSHIEHYLMPVEPQFGEDCFRTITSFKNDFAKFSNTKLFQYIRKSFSVIVGLGYCKAFNVPFTIEGLTIFDASVEPSKFVATDALILFSELVEEMGRVFSACFATRSLSPFLFSDADAETIEHLYLEMVELVPYMINGDLESADSTPESFWTQLDLLNSKLLSAHAGTNHPAEKLQLFNRLVTVRKWISEFNVVQNSGSLREAPFCVSFSGPSGVGKTTIANLINISILKSNNFDADPKKIVSHNENDKYFSNYRADVTSIILDDLANTNLDFLTESPLVSLLKFKNNNPEYAVMADLASKGKIPVRPKTLIVTTNVQDFKAGKFSNCPLSMLRRVDVHVEVSVKPEFRVDGTNFLDQGKVLEFLETKEGSEKLYSDIWEFRVARAVDTDPRRPEDNNISLINLVCGTQYPFNASLSERGVSIDVNQLTKLCIKLSHVHFRNQKTTVRNANQLHKMVDICQECSYPTHCCECIQVQAGMTQENLEERISYYQNCQNYYCYRLFSRFFLGLPSMRVLAFLACSKYWKEFVIRNLAAYSLLTTLFYFAFPLCWKFIFLFIVVHSVHNSYQMLKEYDLCCLHASLKPHFFRNLTSRVRDTNLVWLLGGGASAILMVGAFRSLIRAYKYAIHSGFSPKTESELMGKLSVPNQWDRTVVTPLPATKCALSTTTERSIAKISKNVVYVRYIVGDEPITTTNGFFISSNVLLLPFHNIPKCDFSLEVIRGPMVSPHNSFISKVSIDHIYEFENKDFSLVYISNGGDWSDMKPYFPLDIPRNCGFVMPYRSRDGSISTFKGKTANSEVYNGFRKFQGSYYKLDKPTFNGLCMAPLISDSVANIVLGFHLGGATGTSRGCSGLLTNEEISHALLHLKSIVNIPIATCEGTMLPSKYGATILESTSIDPKSPVNYFPPSTPISVYGSCPGGVKYYTAVSKSSISDSIEVHCGDANIYAGPKFGPETWKPWYKGLEGYSDIAPGPYPSSIKWAVDDYIEPVLQKFDDFEIFRNLKPLSNREVLNGIDGLRFVDRMARNKSVGFPLVGPLSDYMLVDELGEGEVELNPIFWDEVALMEENALNGIRSYPVFKASLKDEVTKVSKDKVRVFTAASMAHKLILRKYFLPLTLVLCSDPSVSECAVGINAYGPEWDDMVTHVTEFGTDRVLAGDFKAYDQKLPPSVTRAAFSVFIRMARKANYSDRDITIMEHLVSDVVHATVAYNGTLIGFNGSQPSGQNLTVFINNISNGILHRCAYLDSSPLGRANTPPFRDNLKMIFYGDDSTGSVNRECTWFNNQVMSSYMDEYGMTYTPPDKAGEHPIFRPKGEVSFLKRDSRYDEDIKHNVGALEMASIFKSLHCVMKSKHVSEKELCATNIDNALRELFLHGRTEYERRRLQLNIVAEECDVMHLCSNLSKSFDDCLTAWKDNYYPDYGSFDLHRSKRLY